MCCVIGQKFTAILYADILSDSKDDILLQLVHFHCFAYVSAGDMNTFEGRLWDMVRNYGHLHNSSQDTHKDCQMAKHSWMEIAELLSFVEAVCRDFTYNAYNIKFLRVKIQKSNNHVPAWLRMRCGTAMSLLQCTWFKLLARHRCCRSLLFSRPFKLGTASC